MTEAEQDTLRSDLEAYISSRVRDGLPLWQFGEYDSADGSMDKKAPRLGDIIANSELWRILLKHMPHAKCRDMYLLRAFESIMGRIKHVNTKDFPDALFLTWLVRCCHSQLTHLREVKRYWARFEYRVKQLDAKAVDSLNQLLAMIKVEAQRDMDVVSKIPLMFVEPAAPPLEFRESPPSRKRSASSLSPSTPLAPSLRIPAIFLSEHCTDPPETPQKKSALASRTLVAKALTTPPLPAGRGSIRAAAASDGDAKGCASGDKNDLVPKIERAYSGRVRSTLRVYIGAEGRRESWAEVTLVRHPCHFEIISEISKAVASGRVTSKEGATHMRDGLLASWT